MVKQWTDYMYTLQYTYACYTSFFAATLHNREQPMFLQVHTHPWVAQVLIGRNKYSERCRVAQPDHLYSSGAAALHIPLSNLAIIASE